MATITLTLTPYSSNTPIPISVESFAFNVEQTLNIGSQSTGAGAGKVTFEPFTITKLVDATSPLLFQDCASGTPFKTATLVVTTTNAAHPVITYTLKLVAIKTIAVAGSQHGGPLMETVMFEYGGLQMKSGQTMPSLPSFTGWDRVRNVFDISNDPIGGNGG